MERVTSIGSTSFFVHVAYKIVKTNTSVLGARIEMLIGNEKNHTEHIGMLVNKRRSPNT